MRLFHDGASRKMFKELKMIFHSVCLQFRFQEKTRLKSQPEVALTKTQVEHAVVNTAPIKTQVTVALLLERETVT